jgi:hypothetical protein
MSQIRELRKARDRAAKALLRTERRIARLSKRYELEERVLAHVNGLIEKRLSPKVASGEAVAAKEETSAPVAPVA